MPSRQGPRLRARVTSFDHPKCGAAQLLPDSGCHAVELIIPSRATASGNGGRCDDPSQPDRLGHPQSLLGLPFAAPPSFHLARSVRLGDLVRLLLHD